MKQTIGRSTGVVIFVSLINLLFPVISLFLNFCLLLFFSHQISDKGKRILRYNLAFSIAFVAFLYQKVNETGDIVRYIYEFNRVSTDYKSFFSNFNLFNYPIWILLLMVIKSLGLSFQWVNFIVFFTAMFNIFSVYNLLDVNKYDKSLNRVFLKFFVFYSWVGLFSSYKNFWAFSFVLVGIVSFLSFKRIKGNLFFITSILIHPVSIIPIIVFFLSRSINFKNIYLLYSIILAFFIYSVVDIFRVLELNLIDRAIDVYVDGSWSDYDLRNLSEFIGLIKLIVLLLFASGVLLFNKVEFERISNERKKYYDFVGLYMCLCIAFITLRTFFMRFMSLGFLFLIPFFFAVFQQRIVFKKKLSSFTLLFLWVLIFELSNFNFWNDSYIIGSGFPKNIFDSPFSLLLK